MYTYVPNYMQIGLVSIDMDSHTDRLKRRFNETQILGLVFPKIDLYTLLKNNNV